MKLLLIEDDDTVRFTVRDALEEHGYTVVECADGSAGLRAIETEPFDLLLTDVRLPGVDGVRLFRQARQIRPGAGVVLMTAFANMDDAVAVMREGARDYVLKPFDMDELLLRIAGVRDEVQVRRSMEAGGASPAAYLIQGNSPASRALRERIEAAAASDASVLITGEMGSGKELCARTIHARGRRWTMPFVVLDCASIPEERFALEVFGAGSDPAAPAGRRRPGRLEDANGGTLFLDEVDALPAASQARLLRVIETSTFDPVGSARPIPANVRLISATRRDLAADVAQGRFRNDLYYRLNVIDVAVPALRDRREDLPALAAQFLSQIAVRDERSAPTLGPAATAALATWGFPGNLRELMHALERAVALCWGDVIGIEHLPHDIVAAPHRGPAQAIDAPGADIRPLGDAVAQFKHEYMRRALERVGGHRARAAALLGISRKSLWQRLRDATRDDDKGPTSS